MLVWESRVISEYQNKGDKMSLCELKKAIREELANYEVVVEIRLKLETHEKIKKELAEMSGIKTSHKHQITSLFGIPIVVDSSIPNDKGWVLTRKSEGVLKWKTKR